MLAKGVTEVRQIPEQPIGDMTLIGLQEALRPAIHEVVAEVVTGVREEGFLTRYDRPTEVLISTMAVRIDAMEDDIVEIKARLGRLEDNLDIHHREDVEEARALRQEMAAEFKAVRQEMATEFKAVRQEIAAESKSVRQDITELHKMMRRQLMWTVATMLTIGGVIIAVVTLVL